MESNRKKVIDQLLGNKKLNIVKGNDESFEYNRIEFGIPNLDKLTGGGIPKKRMTLIYGPTNVGKSYLASQICANVQREGGLAAWVDTELSWDANWMSKCGLDVGEMLLSQPESGEQAFETIVEMMNAGVDVIVLDSIAGLVPAQNLDEDFSFNPMAWQARFVNSSLPKVMNSLRQGSAFIAINQVRSSIGPVALANMPGGLAQGFFSHFLLEVKRSGWLNSPEDKTQKVGFDMEVRLRKTKVGGSNWSSAIVPFRVDGGIDIIESYMRDGITQGVITKAGTWYTFGEDKAQGMNGLKELIVAKPELLKKLKNDVT
jgi:recombination protein RecA